MNTPAILAADALAQGHFGTVSNDSVSLQESFRKYGMAQRSMAAVLAELQHRSLGFECLSEDDWQHLAFFCIAMAFWEVRFLLARKREPHSC